MDGGFARNVAGMGSKSVFRVSVYSSENKALLLPWWKCSSVNNLPPGSWMIPLGNEAISGAQQVVGRLGTL